jgi:hypothetical protein
MAPRESRGMRNASQWRGLYRLREDSSTKRHDWIDGAAEESANQTAWDQASEGQRCKGMNWSCKFSVKLRIFRQAETSQPLGSGIALQKTSGRFIEWKIRCE